MNYTHIYIYIYIININKFNITILLAHKQAHTLTCSLLRKLGAHNQSKKPNLNKITVTYRHTNPRTMES